MNRVAFSLSVLVLSAIASAPALADTYTYTYTGHDFTYTSGGNPNAGIYNPYTTSNFVTGSFTLSAPLAPNLSFEPITIDSAVFTDGVQTLSTGSGAIPSLQVSTDAGGNINTWAIDLHDGFSQVEAVDAFELDMTDQTYYWFIADAGYLMLDPGYEMSGENGNNPGTWAMTVNPDPSATPEPSSLLLLGTALFGSAGILRRGRAS